MTTKIATVMCSGSAREAEAAITRQVRDELGRDVSLLLVFASTAQPLGDLMPALRESFPDTLLLGASTAGELTERGDAKGNVAAFALSGDFRVFAGMGTRLAAGAEAAVTRAATDIPRSVEGYPHRTAILLLDPLAGVSEEATLTASVLLGEDVPLAGGAAGDDLKMTATHVGLGSNVASDAVVIAVVFSKTPLGVGVCHGHEPISPPLHVTRAAGNVVFEIDGRPAWDVWVDETRASAAKRGVDTSALGADDIGAFLLRYEAGLPAGEEHKIRAPLSRGDDGSLAFACGIPTGAKFHITESTAVDQIASAREAAKRARAKAGGGEIAGALVFDCICRNLILGSEFGSAVGAITEELGGAPVAGFETYGEIALDAGDLSGFHNTTTVVLAFPR